VAEGSKLSAKEKFIANVGKEYYGERRIIESLAETEYVSNTDGSFTQIAIRHGINEKIIAEKFSGYARELIGAGHSIVIGELRFFVKQLIKRISKTIEIDFSELDTISTILSQHQMNTGSVAMLTTPTVDMHLSLKKLNSWDYSSFVAREYLEGCPGTTIVSFNDESLADSVIVYKKNLVTLSYFGGEDSNLQVLFGKKIDAENIDLTIKSVVKLHFSEGSVIQIKIKNIPKKK
jgi:hypothetical protein